MCPGARQGDGDESSRREGEPRGVLRVAVQGLHRENAVSPRRRLAIVAVVMYFVVAAALSETPS